MAQFSLSIDGRTQTVDVEPNQPLLYAPSVGVPHERIQANVQNMFEIFGSKG